MTILKLVAERDALQILADALMAYRCHDCDAHNEHAVCETPDWADIGVRMTHALNGYGG